MDVEGSKETSKNEIDYILTNRKSTVKNVEVIQRVNVGGDRRLVEEPPIPTQEQRGVEG